MALPDGFLRELRDNNDIVSVVQGYVELKRSGSTYSCRCPFHSERTPSCHIYPDTQSFYCFGCGAGGDVVTFIKNIENLDYMESVRFLAQRAGMAMPEDRDDGSARLRQRLYEMNRTAGKFFHEMLFSEEGRAGYNYITGRNLSLHTIKRFGIGFAPNDYHKLHFYMRSKGFSDDELVQGALLARNNNRVYDKFRNRVMFPIFDTRGNVIAFGGRTLDPDSPAKYLNSDETFVFQKRETLFALNYAKNSKADYFILCEGYMDVIAMHQAGFNSAVATLGTAITANQARLIGRMGKSEVILSYDSDGPGQKAASKGINLLTEAGVKARVLKMTGAKDPDEFITKYGAEAFAHLLESSGGAIDYELSKLGNGLDLTNKDEDRSTYLKRAVVFLAQISNPLDRDVYISRTAETAGIPAETVRFAVKSEMERRMKRSKRDETNNLIHPRNTDKINPQSAKLPREEKAERGILCFLYNNPEKLGYIERELKGGFATDFNRRVFDFMKNRLEAGLSLEMAGFNEEFDGSEMGRITGILNDFAIFSHDTDVLGDYIKTLNEYSEGAEKKDAGSMSTDELLAFVQKQKEKKNK
ncbi:MAG: DNA primase [Oscillospiraceae bacterium]|nr:DNA primase [Oscillospiraceae bacterium]